MRKWQQEWPARSPSGGRWVTIDESIEWTVYDTVFVCLYGEQYDKARQELMQSELRRMMDQKLSDNLYEIVSKSL